LPALSLASIVGPHGNTVVNSPLRPIQGSAALSSKSTASTTGNPADGVGSATFTARIANEPRGD
jgi:hypothetical protein